MSKQHTIEFMYAAIGSITTVSVGAVLLQGLGALILGILGAIGGYLFSLYVKPQLDKHLNKKKKPEA